MDTINRNSLRQGAGKISGREVNRRKDEFIALLAHELRNPLSAILGALQILDQSEGIPQVAQELLGVIQRQAQLMKMLSEELLDNSRVANGKINLQKKRLDFTALATHTISDYRHCFEANCLTLETHFSPESLWVDGDGVRLSQVITNLLHNATKFTDSGGNIQVRVERQDGFVVLSVCDSGIGMVPTEVAVMFEPYRQSDSPRVRIKGGLGLGLSLSKRLIEMHDGSINAESDGLGCGSTFSFRLPMASESRPQPIPPMPNLNVALRSRRVLIVDDRRDARLVLTVLLKGLKQEVREAETGTSALALLEVFQPEIVFCDIGLTDMLGYAVAKAIRSNPALGEIRLVALTGSGGVADKARAMAAGFDRFLTKPVTYDELEEVLLDQDGYT